MANSTAIEQQHGNFEAKAARELGIGVDVHHRDGGDGLRALELGERVQHVFTETAALAAEHHEAGGKWAHLLRGRGASPMPWEAADAFEVALTCVAMNCTVFGGTSPIAVTW